MGSNILSIGKSALAAAQAGLATAGHNIANASTPGYSRQVVVQSAAQAQDFGYGFLGQGTEVSTIKRVYSDFLARQVTAAHSSKTELDSYYTQIRQIDNLLADSSTGLAPAVQDFFNGVQDLASNPGSNASRQSVLAAGEGLASRFQLLGQRLDEIAQGINSEISSSIGAINSYAQQLAQLNNAIQQAEGGGNGQPPNDLLDQRDALLSDLSKEVRATVIKQDGGMYNVFVGNGLPLVVGGQSYELQAGQSQGDPSRIEPYYASNGTIAPFGDQNAAGGRLGGLLDFRATTLDAVQSSLGRIAIGLAASFNAQHRLGQDINGNLGTDFFSVGEPSVGASRANTGNAKIAAVVVDASALTTSSYALKYDGSNYLLTRFDDGVTQSFASLPQTVDGVTLTLTSGAPSAGDQYLFRPAADGAGTFSVAFTDPARIAAAAPIRTAAAPGNTGAGKISAGVVDSSYLGAALTLPISLSYSAFSNELVGFPPGVPVSVTSGGTVSTFPAGSPVIYTDGGEISFGGVNFTVSGTPGNGDVFTIGANQAGIGDNRNALRLAVLQTARTLSHGSASYEGVYGQLVSLVGNKTRELEVTSTAAEATLSEALAAQQSESGVNLDEEATNLLRYQQAYQAAGKVIQIANEVFNVLLGLGD
jgi:flagellar hook-associated protein 1 FlgK